MNDRTHTDPGPAANVVDLAARRHAKLEAEHAEGALFKFECMHAEDFSCGTNEGQVVLHRHAGVTGFQMSPEDAENIGLGLIQAAAIARLEREKRIQYVEVDDEDDTDDAPDGG